MTGGIPPRELLAAYAQGVFPMAHEGRILWFSPEQRGLIPLDQRFHIPRTVRQSLRRKPFDLRWDHDFESVIRQCATREDTWINDSIVSSYCRLHQLGFAHSVECWDDEGLAGALYGVALGRVFFGESMFTHRGGASKIALVALVERLRECRYLLLDTQWMTAHLSRFGGYEVPRDEYERILAETLALGPADPL